MPFHFIAQLFKRTSRNAEKLTAFTDAYEWIVTYNKAEEYETAIMASRELLLKIKTGITYYTEAEKKVANLAASNIEDIAKAAKQKAKLITSELRHLYEWETKLRNLIDDCEKNKLKRDERRLLEKHAAEIRSEIAVIETHIKKKEISQALHLAKKLAAAYFEAKEATDMLNRVQKLYDKTKSKEEQAIEEKKKRDRFFREAGINDVNKATEKPDLEKKGKISPIDRARFYLWLLREKQKEKREYLKRQKSLRNIERMLIETGSISKITENDNDEEILSIMESGLTKDISNFKIDGYDFYGKIVGKDKIVGDTFGSYRDGWRTVFYFGDATGHGIQAGFTVSLLNKIFFEQAKKIRNFAELFMTVNNELKAKLRWRLFVTGVFMEHDTMTGKLRFIGAGHDPMFFYNSNTSRVEKIIPGGLALGVRNITNVDSLKVRELPFSDQDILVGYTDGIIEARNAKGELYGLDRLSAAIDQNGAEGVKNSPGRLYQLIMEDVQEYMGNEVFMDDVSCFIFKRDSNLDIISNKADLDLLLKELDVNSRTLKLDLKGKTRAEVQEELRKEKQKRELNARLANMEQLYKIGEYARLKAEVTLCYKMGFVHDKMNFYLAKILKNEEKTKVLKLEDRLQRKYEMLKELYDKGEYGIVIREAIDILYKNGNI